MQPPGSHGTARSILRRERDTLPRELFALYARNAVLLRIIAWTGLAFGGLLAAMALWSALLGEGNARFYVGASTFFTAALILTPSLHLLHYRATILEALSRPDGYSLELLLHQQRRFWRFVGGIVVGYFSVLVGMIVLAFAIGKIVQLWRTWFA